ncbi:uncharacterized protein TM35_000381480, partial [Trypanosoma theileri]
MGFPISTAATTGGSTQGLNEPLVPCSICGRSFRSSILSRHENACVKVQKKRRAFDMKGQRLDGIEGINEVINKNTNIGGPIRGGKKSNNTNTSNVNSTAAGKLPKWKIQHEQFQAAMRAMRQVNTGNPNDNNNNN